MNSIPRNEKSADFEELTNRENTSKYFMISLVSFLTMFIFPFSLTFWPIVVGVIISSLFGVVSGHRAFNKIKKIASSGKGLTVVGLVLGYIALASSSLWLILLILWMSGSLSMF